MSQSKLRVVVGMSGGVDSAVCALLMKNEGYEVIGVNMIVHPGNNESKTAKAVADQIGIPFHTINLVDEFKTNVSHYLRDEYLAGRTPNPCVVCNRRVKFGAFWDKIEATIGTFDFFATGHYANIGKTPSGRLTIIKGKDSEKDQAYFLSMLTQEQIAKVKFPLFGLQKADVRKIATEAGLENSQKKESQDLCTGDYLEHIPTGSGVGNFVHIQTGKVLCEHHGIEHYTVGQRRGLNIGGTPNPLYVIKIDRESNLVYVGEEESLLAYEMWISHINWVGEKEPALPWAGRFKIRYRDSGSEGQLVSLEERADRDGNKVHWGKVVFPEGVRAVTPGQLAVAYTGESWNSVAFAGFIEG